MSRVSFRSEVLSGLRWVVAARLGGQLVTWAFTVVVMRLLHPSDYGVMAMATVFVSFIQMLKEFGLGAALVQKKELSEETIRQTFGFLIVANLFFFLLVLSLAPFLAWLYDERRVNPVLSVLAAQFLFVPFETIPSALLLRKMQFRKTAVARLVSSVLGGGVTLAFAVLGYGVWALVAGALATGFVETVTLNLMASYARSPSFSFRGLSGVLSFGGLVTIDQVLWFFYSQSDIFIVGKLLGTAALGFYSVAIHLASLPMQRMNYVLNSVAFPAFSRIQDDREKLRAYLAKALRLVSVVTCPLFLGMAAVAPDAVPFLLGERWREAVLPLSMVSVVMPVRMAGSLLPIVTRGAGRADIGVVNLTIASVVMPVAFIIGSLWGLAGVSTAWVVAYPVVFLIEVTRSRVVTGLTIVEVTKQLARPWAAALGMFVGVLTIRSSLRLAPAEALIVEITAGMLLYGVFLRILDRDAVRDTFSLLRL